MTDLLTPEMPAELLDKLTDARRAILEAADEVDGFLFDFFHAAWAACHRTHTVPTFKLVKGERVEFTVEVPGTPDFNEFDRRTRKYALAVSKLRSMLWDIHSAATSQNHADPVEGGKG